MVRFSLATARETKSSFKFSQLFPAARRQEEAGGRFASLSNASPDTLSQMLSLRYTDRSAHRVLFSPVFCGGLIEAGTSCIRT